MNHIDHRGLGLQLELFHQQEAAPGMVFWHPRGYALVRVVEDYIRARMGQAGFQEVRTPLLLARSLWEQSGHWEKFGDQMYSLKEHERPFCLKPMSCPCHVQIFNKRVRSYRELPVRYAEFGVCHRDEPSGSLHGLMRTKAFVQDDAHILCMVDQVEGEVKKFCVLLRQIYADFGFPDFKVALSTRPALRAGSDEVWDEAEAALAAAARAAGLEFAVQPGEGAFYGPKLEFHLTDKQDRDWQCGTIQLDMVLPGRLNAGYISADNQREVPVMIHHAVLGSVERFSGILLEHYEGWLPLWLAPEQVVVANVSDASADYAADVAAALRAAGIRVSEDFRAERLPRKIIDARERFLPVFLAVGERDRREGTVSLRWRDGSQEVLKLEHGIARLRAAVRSPVGA